MLHWQFTETKVYVEILKIARLNETKRKLEITSNTNKNDKTT